MYPLSRLSSRFVPGRSIAAWLVFGAALVLLPAGDASAFVSMENPGCQEGEYVRWRGGPTTWHLNERGYSGIEFERLQATLQQGVDAWSAPCCSGFRSSYLGTTSQGVGFPPEKNVLLFEEVEANWPQELGRAGVIATTMRQGTPWCSLTSAFMIFNAIDFEFTPPDAELGAKDVDLLSIAVHEFGHWLGLLHTDVADAIMRPSYSPGTRFIELHQDDIDGVCALYPGSCEACSSDADCPAESACVEGACILADCRTTLDCAMGTICEGTSCVPGCRAHVECGEEQACVEGACVDRGARCEKHVDCAAGESCVNGRCGAQPTRCAICEACTFDSDCGLDAYCMSTNPSGGGGRCIKPCEADRECGGDSVCRAPAGNPFKYCLNPSSDPASVCPASYQCEVTEPGPALGCALLGEPCTGGSQGCGGRSDTCYDLAEGPACSCTCGSDDECGPGARCLADPSSDDLPSCFPVSLIIPCGETACAPGQRCGGDERCEADPCSGVSCAEGETCVEGSCTKDEEEEEEDDPKAAKTKKAAKSGCAAAGVGDVAPLLALLCVGASIRLLRSRETSAG